MRYVVAILGLAGALYALSGVTQVPPGGRAIVRRFGKVVAKPGPGLWIGWPAGIDRVDIVPIDQIRRVRVGYEPETADLELATPPGQVLSGDYNLVNVQAVVDYAVREEDVENFVVNQDRVEGLIARVTEAVIADWIAARRVDDVMIRGKGDLPSYVLANAEKVTETYGMGVRLVGVSIPLLLPPDEVRPAFDDVSRAQTAIRTREFEARQDSARRLREAQAEAERIRSLTGAYVQSQRITAQAEAASFEHRLAQFNELKKTNPHALEAIWWDEMGKLLSRLKERNKIDLLDHHLNEGGLDIITAPPLPSKP
jgi:membrane protease subunit HflK